MPRHALLSLVAFLLFPALLRAAPEASFADLDTGRAAIVDDADYFDRLQPMEMAAKTGQPLAAKNLADQRAECRRRYQAAVREFADDEKAAIRGIVARVNAAAGKSYPLYAGTPWNFIKVAGNIEGGFPHTRGKYIILAERVCRGLVREEAAARGGRPPLGAMELLLHEQMHVFQRAHADLFDSLYTGKWGFVKAKSVAACPWIVEHQLLNPDAVDSPWVFPIRRPEGTFYIWPRASLSDGPGPKRMAADFSEMAFYVTRDGDNFRIERLPDGRPKSSPLMSVKAYREVFPLSTNIYHPHEASADLFAKLVVFDSHRSAKMDAAERAEQERTFGPLREWFQSNLAVPFPGAKEQ